MLSKVKNQEKGFTIIEVLIVLVIAGLIMLIVFLAVPALQRSSRNTQRRDDVAKLLAIASEFSNNNNGTLPTAAGCFGTTAFVNAGTGTQSAAVEMANYCRRNTATDIRWDNTTTANPNDINVVIMRSNARCDGTTGNATTTGANARGIVALYTLEQGVLQCQAS